MHRLPGLIVFWFAVSAVIAIAAPPQPKIAGPTGGLPGDILLLDATQSVDCDHFDWSVTPRLPEGRPTILPIEGGSKVIVTSVPGTYTIFLAAGNGEGVKIVEWAVSVGSTPGPGPAPVPPPQPEPDPPAPEPQPPAPQPDRFGLSTKSASWAVSVTGATRQAEAQALAAAFESSAAEVAARSLTAPTEIVTVLAKHCSAAISDAARRAAWAVFDSGLQSAISEIWKAGLLKTTADWAEAFRAVAAGLKSVR